MNSFIIKTKIRRWLNRMFKFEHFSSAPFLSGDTFRSLCNHTYDEFSDVSPADVQRGDIVFVKNSFVRDFFAHIHPHIQHQYILLNHNDDTTIDESYIQYIDDKIIHWFGLNINVVHPKMTPLPIGLENLRSRRNGLLHYFLKQDSENTTKRINKILVAFHTNNVHPERLEAFVEAKKLPLADIFSITQNHSEYIRKVSMYTHILSPRGAGVDCHRTWESLYLGTTPIVRACANTTFFKSIGVPIVLVDEWRDLQTFNAIDTSTNTNEHIHNKEKHPALYIEYWIQLIHNKRI